MSTVLHQEPTMTLDATARRWLAENLMEGFDPDQLAGQLVTAGYDRRLVDTAAAEILRDPVYDLARTLRGQLRKTESLLGVYRQLDGLVRPPGTIDRRRHVSAEEFLHTYYAANTPVVLNGVAARWPARARWNPEYLRERCGAETVEVMTDREGDERFEVNADAHRHTMLFSEYVDTVMATQDSNDNYLVANNHFLDSPCGTELLADLHPLPDFLASRHTAGTTFMWFGPAGTLTPLHHDAMNVLLVQVLGSKRVTLVPSDQLPLVYNHESVYSEVCLEAPDLVRHPRFAATERIEVTLEPGDGLFIPVGWWHHVLALEVSISTSFTSFAYPNTFEWQHPEPSD